MAHKKSNIGPFVLTYGAYVAALHLIDGPWRDWKKEDGAVLDTWTLTHVAWGAIAQAFGLTLEEITALSAVNELGEYAVRETRPDLLFGTPETAGNVAFDLVSTNAGWLMAQALFGEDA